MAEQYEEALAEYKRALQKGGYNPAILHFNLAGTYAMLGQEGKARHHATEALKIYPKFSLKDHEKRVRFFFKNQADIDHVINALRKAGLPEKPPLPLPDKPSIAVLPFTNISGDPEQEYFSDGMTDTLITDLSKISGLFVIARNSVFTYKGKPVKVDQIGRELGVRYVMEGSVQKANNQVRINAQLIDTKTGGHLWAERYDGKMDDIFALQDEIIGKIVSAMAVKLTASEKEQVAHKYTDNIEAYDAFLKGLEHFLRLTPDDSLKAISYLKKAIELDPNYGRAYAVLGFIYWLGPKAWTDLKWPDKRVVARNYLELAMKNPSPAAHQLAAVIKLRLRQYKEAISEAERALALTPNDPGAHGRMADVLISAGRPKEAIEYAKFEMRFDPRRMHLGLFRLGTAYFSMGQLEQAATYFERSLTHNPKFPRVYTFLAATYAHLGRDQKAREALENYYSFVAPFRFTLRALMYWYPFKDPEVAERFAYGLLKAGMKGEPSGYYEILEENRLTGEEIRKLVFGQEIRYRCQWTGLEYVNLTKDGTIMDGERTIGKSRIDGDMLCNKRASRFDGLEYCGTVFRNPEGTADMGNEYLYVTDFDICVFNPLPVK
jgi:TolB-like protein